MSSGWGTVLAIAGILLVSGCQPAGVGQASRDARADFLLDEEPGGARGVLETKAAFEAERSEPSAELAILGRIGGTAGFIWDPDRAAFTLLDATAGEDSSHGGAGHSSDGCPFCREREKKAAAAVALVQLVDARGDVPPVDARRLLGLAEGQTIVVVGQAGINSLGQLDIWARRVYVRP